MEQGRTSLNKAEIAANQLGSGSTSINTARLYSEKSIENRLLYDEAVSLGADWIQAGIKKRFLSPEQYQNLYEKGFVSPPVETIYGIFYDWDDYKTVSETFHQDRLEKKRLKDERLLASVREEVSLGIVPKTVLRKSKAYEKKYSKPDPNNPGVSKQMRFVKHKFSGKPAPDEQILQRYTKLLVTDFLLEKYPREQEVPESRKLSLALGFSIDSGKPLSSFLSALQNSIAGLTELQLEEACHELDLYEYIHARRIKQDLNAMVRASLKPATVIERALLAA